MGGVIKQRSFGRVVAGILLIAGALPVTALATLIVEQNIPVREISSPTRATAGVDIRELRQAVPGISPGLGGIDDGFLMNRSLMHSELQDQLSFSLSPRSARAKSPERGSDIFGEAVDEVLKATREAFFDGEDTASFSLAGIELNVTLRGDRSAVSVNGLDLLGSGQDNVQAGERWLTASTSTIPQTANFATDEGARQPALDQGPFTMLNLRQFLSHPLTIITGIALAGIWLMLLIAEIARSRQP